MDSFELVATLDEHGITVPERCAGCSRLGAFVATLSLAQDHKRLLTNLTDPEILTAHFRAQLTAEVAENYPDVDEEIVASTVGDSVVNYVGSNRHTESLMRAGRLIEMHDAVIDASLAKITTQLAACPTPGCNPVSTARPTE